MVVAEDLARVPVDARLIFAGEVQVDIRHLVALEAEEGLERNVKALLGERFAAFRTDLVRQVDAAGVILVPFDVLVVRTEIVRRERINLGDVRHERRERRADRAARADQIAVRERLGNELLRDDVHDGVAVADDGVQLAVESRLHLLGQRVAVDALCLVVAHIAQIVLAAVDVWRVVLARNRTDDVAHVRDHVGVLYYDLIRTVLAEIGELLQHFVRGLEVERRLIVGVRKALTGHEDAAEGLVLGLEEVNVAGRAARLAQLVCEAQDVAVPVAQLLLVLREPLGKHEFVVADRLDLEVVIELGQPLDLVPLRALGKRAEYLARLARRAEDQPLAVTDELAARHDGALVVVFEKALGNELIQVAQTGLIFDQNDKVEARQVFQLVFAVGRRCEHRIDVRRRDRVHLVLEPREQLDENAAEHRGILAGAVMLERADLKLLGEDVQLEFMQMRQHEAAHFERVDAGELPLDAKPFARCPQKAHIEACVVRDERILPLPRPHEEFRYGFVEVGRVCNGLIRNAGQLGDLGRDGLVRIDVGLERVTDLALDHAHRGNFGDLLVRRVETGRLEVEHDERAGERLGAPAAHDRQAVRVVDVVRFDAVNDLHVPDDVLLLALLRVERLGKGLRDAVVGDGHGTVAPLCRAAQQRGGRAHAVHRGHIGMQVQLDALHAVIGVLSLRLFRLDDAGRLEHHFARVGVEHHFALHSAVQTFFDERGRVAGLVSRKELGDAHGIRAVSDVERDLHIVLAGLFAVDILVLGEEHLALNGDHVVGRNGLVDRDNGVLNELSEHEIVFADLLGLRALVCRAL